MTDDPFDQDLRETLRRLMDEPAPADLRRRVARAQVEPSGPRARTMRPRLAWFAAAVAILAVLAVPVAVSMLAPRPPVTGTTQPAPGSPTASASATSPVPLASAAPTLPPWANQLGMPLLTVSPSVVRSVTTADPPTAIAGGAPTGPFAYVVGGDGNRVQVVDIGGGSVRTADPTPVHAGERAQQVLSNGSWLVLEVVSDADPCTVSTPMTWRIVVAPVGTDGMPGAFADVAKGAVKAQFQAADVRGMNCPKDVVPPAALAGDRLAWAIQASSALDTGSIVSIQPINALGVAPSRLETPTLVTQLALSGEAIAWVEEENGMANGFKPAWRVMEAPLATLTPGPVDVGEVAGRDHSEAPWVVLDGSAVFASRDQYAAGSGTVVRVDGGRLETLDPGMQGRSCGAFAADAGRALLSCGNSKVQNGVGYMVGDYLAVWTAADGLRAITIGTSIPSPFDTWLRQGWLGGGAGDGSSATFFAIPLDALGSPSP
jgi:hypothetical protein